MPELPEVETVKRGLEPHFSGSVIRGVEQRRADLRFAFPHKFAERITGARCDNLERRAKYIIARLENGQSLIMHLGMSGRFSVHGPQGTKVPASAGGETNPKHDHVVFQLSDEVEVRYNDPRRFGYMDLIETDALGSHKYFMGLGPEPLGNEFHEDYLKGAALARKTPLKSFLLDQRVVAGLGNIYVLEALHEAGLSPLRLAETLNAKRGTAVGAAGRLVVGVREVLKQAIAAGGSTLKDYAKTDGTKSYFQHSFQVYGREGEDCRRAGCEGKIKRIVQSGRSSFFCPSCQK